MIEEKANMHASVTD